MDFEINESDQIRHVVHIKKERFRIEIRKSKNKEEFAIKRIKFMKEKDIFLQEIQLISNKQCFSLHKESKQMNPAVMICNENQRNEKDFFFNKFDNDNSKNNKDKMLNYGQCTNNISQPYQESDYLVDENVLALLEEFNSNYQDGNRKVFFEKLCQIRKKLTIASSQQDAENENIYKPQRKQKNNRDGENSICSQNYTMKLVKNYYNPVFSTILANKKFLNIILDILKNTEYKQLKEIQQECMWILINLCTGKNQECLIMLNLGVLDTFKYLMEYCNDFELLEYVCWCLGNLAADDAECREKLFEDSSLIVDVIQKFYEKLIVQLTSISETDNSTSNHQNNKITDSKIQLAQDYICSDLNSCSSSQKQNQISNRTIFEFVFFLSNLIKKHPMPRIDPLRNILSVLKELFFLDLPQIKLEIIKSFRVLLMKSERYLNEVLKLDIIRHIMPFLEGKNINLIKESLNLFIVVTQNVDEFTHKQFVDVEFQEYLEKGLNCQNREIKFMGIKLIQTIIDFKKSLNIVAENLIQEKLLKKLLNMLIQEDFQIKAAIVALLKDILESDLGVQQLINLNYIEILIGIGMCSCSQIEKLVIQSLELIFQYGETDQYEQDLYSYDEPQNQILSKFYSKQGQILIEQLQQSKSGEVNQMCMQMVKNYLID